MAIPIWEDEAVLAKLTTAITASSDPATIDVDGTGGWPDPGAGEFAVGYVDQADPVKIDRFEYTGKTATTLTGVTWPNGSKAHSVDALVSHSVGAPDLNEINNALSSKQALSVVDAKGDLIVGSADNATDNLTVGADGKVLLADSAETLGVKWGDPPASGPQVEAKVTAGSAASESVTWTTAFAATPVVVVSPDLGGSTNTTTAYTTSRSTTGATVQSSNSQGQTSLVKNVIARSAT